jgi:hypothetical protein
MRRYKLRILLIGLAIGLVLLRVALRLIPDCINLPGGILTWYVLMIVYHRVIPFGVILALVGAVIVHFLPSFGDRPPSKGATERSDCIMQVRLRIMLGPNAGKEIKIPIPHCIIGREEGCHVKINNHTISPKHCVIETNENGIVVRDLNSRLGTFVNAQRVAGETKLLSDDILAVGDKQFVIIIVPLRPKV